MTEPNDILFPDEQPELWAEIILPLALAVVYTYAVPPDLADRAKPGCRAEVVFGKNKKYAGIIRRVLGQKPSFPAKPILNVLDDEPIVGREQLLLWEWMAQYYMCTEGEVMAAALPANFKLSSETILIYNDEAGDDFTHLDSEEYLVAEALILRKQLHMQEVQQILETSHVYPVIKKLLDKKICFSWEKLHERYQAKKENFVLLNPRLNNEESLSALLNDWKGAPKQMELLLAFLHLEKSEPEVSQSALLKKSGATAAQLKALADKQILLVERRKVDRIRLLPRDIHIDFTLSPAQQQCLAEVEEAFRNEKACLLHGVTGSGKTQVYIRLMESHLRSGKQVLYLLPEIALTAQIIRRLQKHFGGHIAIYHSKFNDQERVEIWNRVRSGDTRIVIGARSALFLPFHDLGLVIVDEEHDASYKQYEPSPRYHARDSAVYYASLFKANVLLGSATPSMETYFNTRQGKYALVRLTERFGGLLLPDIQLVNMRQVAQKGKVMLSPALKEAIRQAVDKGSQVILFQNRRGYNPYLICGTCGHIPQCTHCDVSLTLHKYSNKLHCHYCGSTYPKLITCPACGSNNWLEKNFGTEKIEEMLEEEFPSYRVARMDVDSIRGKTAHDSLIQQFEQRRLDILVGTQMVVKGLDFDNVSLVGILDADGLLSFTDFRVNERAFQLMEQVSGRAGRKLSRGLVLIQALQVSHPVIQWVQNHDYESFFDAELASRRIFAYPPFSRIVKLTVKHADKDTTDAASWRLMELLGQDMKEFLVGPATPVIGRIRNQYLSEIMLKLPKEPGRSIPYKQVIRNQINLMLADKRFRAVTVVSDVDPQ
jgi:primosomal protein N' (replication factor Y)